MQILKTIPPDVSVSAMNNLGPHLANRRFIYRFPIKYLEADYVVVDPLVVSTNFDLSQIKIREFESLILDLRRSPNYETMIDRDRLLVLKRRTP